MLRVRFDLMSPSDVDHVVKAEQTLPAHCSVADGCFFPPHADTLRTNPATTAATSTRDPALPRRSVRMIGSDHRRPGLTR
jgi:hypothetical protein